MASAPATSPASHRQAASGPGATTTAGCPGTAADALFASLLQPSDNPTIQQVRLAIAQASAGYGDTGCAAKVAQAYGDHPENAAARMRWARTLAARAVPSSSMAA